MKRLLSVLLALALCLPFAVPAKAAVYGQLTYEIVDGEVTVTRCAYDAVGSVVVPDTIEGYPVTAIADAAFYGCYRLSSITFPQSLERIGKMAFYDCYQLKTLYFYGDAPTFGMSYDMCYNHTDNAWDDLDFDFSMEHECGPFENVNATVYYPGDASGWDAVTSEKMTGRGCNYTDPNGRIILNQIIPASLSGTLTAFGEGAVALELTSGISYPVSLSVTEKAYQLQNSIPGEYTLTVSQTGTVTRTYTLNLNEGENALDLTIHQPGDINGDGRYDIGDVAQIYAHVKLTKALTDYPFLCADFTGDGKITVGDAAKAYALLQGK